MAIPKAIRKSLLEELQEVIRKTQEQIQPLLQQEQDELGNEKLERFHRENPHRYAVAEAIYKRFRERQKKHGVVCHHVKGLQPILLKALGYDMPGPTREDYNIGWHTLPDGRTKIWCLQCGQHFTPSEAKKMLEQSSNSRSSSEVVLQEHKRFPEDSVVFMDSLK